MSKYANAGELRMPVYFQRVERITDGEGYPQETEVNVFGQDKYGREIPVYAKWVNAHGTETFTAMQLELREPATLTVRYSPQINDTLVVYKGSELDRALHAGDHITDQAMAQKTVQEALKRIRYEVVSIDNVEERNAWLEIKVQRKVAAR